MLILAALLWTSPIYLTIAAIALISYLDSRP